jgi:hypothetical protein
LRNALSPPRAAQKGEQHRPDSRTAPPQIADAFLDELAIASKLVDKNSMDGLDEQSLMNDTGIACKVLRKGSTLVISCICTAG